MVDYAEMPFPKAFNWDELMLPEDEACEWYSCSSGNYTTLCNVDHIAPHKPIQNGGLIIYWYGKLNPCTWNNLATCIWQSPAHAIPVNAQLYHRWPTKFTKVRYKTYELQRWVLTKEKGSRV
ncbi:hypothetical protein BS47DRAFT_1296646 [Hydnum rufescens UP504]|uniref:Uncharacterized protein n=1 Tax=Hydnum rufescens UP504 TaxID=1448309 RepID=A0A9P6AWF6_9AGAM|nr:hypothetical protein BS47DRAFT_1296646 [Hydnum rufescens UP504]